MMRITAYFVTRSRFGALREDDSCSSQSYWRVILAMALLMSNADTRLVGHTPR